MSDAPVDAALSDEEIDRLEQLLAARNGRLTRVDAVQGLCVAIAIGPDAEIANRWLDVVLGERAPRDDDAEVTLLLERYRASTAADVANRTLAIRSHRTRTGREDYTAWCSAFLDGIEISETDWFSVADPEELDELLFPIEVLADALSDGERSAYKPNDWRKLVRDAQDSLASTVMRLADYWAILRAPPVTVRRAEPKVRRNDKCPCGSGRKFKQCHGGR